MKEHIAKMTLKKVKRSSTLPSLKPALSSNPLPIYSALLVLSDIKIAMYTISSNHPPRNKKVGTV